jgi:hypothetical protein
VKHLQFPLLLGTFLDLTNCLLWPPHGDSNWRFQPQRFLLVPQNGLNSKHQVSNRSEASNKPDGRSYYFNSRLNQTTWEKPDALKTPAEIRLAKIPWKEYSTPEGRKYWNNSETGESVWSMPQAYKDAVNGPAKANG